MRDDFFRRILVVDDDPPMRKTICSFLRKLGYAADEAGDAATALSLLGRKQFDLVISDVVMEGKDGVTLMQEARILYPVLEFIIITGFSQLYSYEDITAAGAFDYLTKPFAMSDLQTRIERCRRQKWTQEELKKYQTQLEELVKERTAKLELEIKERRLAEATLRESEARFRKFSEEASHEGIIFQDDGKIIDVNETLAKMSGYSRDELIGKDVLQLVDPEYWPVIEAHMIRDCEEEYEIVACRKDGVRVPLEVHAKVIPYLGKMMRVAAVRDITDRKRSEEALLTAHQRLLDIIEFLPDATFVIDRDGRVIAWNRAMEEMSGVRKDVMLGKSNYAHAVPFYGLPRPMMSDLLIRHDPEVESSYEQIDRTGNSLCGEGFVPGIHGGKGGYVWGTASLLTDRQGNVVGAIESIRDMSERKAMESALRQREQDLEAKSRDLEEINTALKVLLKRRLEDQQEFGANVWSNIKELVFPYLEKLRRSRLNELQKTYLEILEAHLQDIAAPFFRNLSSEFVNLSPMELQIASLIKAGKRNKEISEILGVSVNTILTHRHHLRTKLGVKNKGINLVAHLKTMGI